MNPWGLCCAASHSAPARAASGSGSAPGVVRGPNDAGELDREAAAAAATADQPVTIPTVTRVSNAATTRMVERRRAAMGPRFPGHDPESDRTTGRPPSPGPCVSTVGALSVRGHSGSWELATPPTAADQRRLLTGFPRARRFECGRTVPRRRFDHPGTRGVPAANMAGTMSANSDRSEADSTSKAGAHNRSVSASASS